MIYEVFAKEYDLRSAQGYLESSAGQIAKEIETSHYSQRRIRDSLNNDVDKTINALILLTMNGKINLSEESGKLAWKSAIDYLNEKGLTDELQTTEKSLYNVSVTWGKWKRRKMETSAQLAGVLWKSITFGLALGYPVIIEKQRKAYHKYIMDQLYPNTEN